MERILKFLGKEISQIDLNDVEKLCNNEEILVLFSEPNISISFCKELFETNTNKDVLDQFKPIATSNELILSEMKLGKIFREYDEHKDKEKLFSILRPLLVSDNPYEQISTSFVTMLTVPKTEINVSEYESNIKVSIQKIKQRLFDLNMDYSYAVICELLDMIYSMADTYFKNYEIDLIKEDVELKEYLVKLNEFIKPIQDELLDEVEEIMNGTTPEELGLLDITKGDK